MAAAELQEEYKQICLDVFTSIRALDAAMEDIEPLEKALDNSLRRMMRWTYQLGKDYNDDPFTAVEQVELLKEVANEMGLDFERDPFFEGYRSKLRDKQWVEITTHTQFN